MKITQQQIYKELNYIDPSEKTLISNNITKPMSDNDILNYLGHYNKNDILMYSYLHKYNALINYY